ncbi:shikimate kinase [Agrococcus baldri]|uniref:Shikimate kinase n=1 Tax=Agrococcus baldri TaxID=153730 RepID=A0AA87US11_9MICO|nr:shikimate kinase [Agrococcus baldri]GEK80536.1 shikimate kinase [Agrococcus baldri]
MTADGPRPGDEASATPPIALIGPMAAGKTSIGRKLASRIGRTFADTDRLVTLDHGPIPAIFAEHGEPAFRAWEAEAVQRALTPGSVVALGGGAVLDEGTRALLREQATVVLVTVDELAAERRIVGDARPLVADGIAAWRRIAGERDPIYRELADTVVDTSRTPMARLVDQLEAWLEERGL